MNARLWNFALLPAALKPGLTLHFIPYTGQVDVGPTTPEGLICLLESVASPGPPFRLPGHCVRKVGGELPAHKLVDSVGRGRSEVKEVEFVANFEEGGLINPTTAGWEPLFAALNDVAA